MHEVTLTNGCMIDSKFNLIKASASDIALLIDFRISFCLELSGPQTQDVIDELRKSLKSYLANALIENSCIAYIVRDGEDVAAVGEMIFRLQPGNFKNPSGKVGYLMNMYTIPAYRKQGLCSMIVNALIEDANKQGINAFELHSTKAGESVYIKNGFRIHPEPTYRKYIQ